MKIREQNERRMVIASSSRWWLLPPVLILAVCIPIVIVFFVHLDVWLVILLSCLIWLSVVAILAQSAHARVTIDKRNKRISVRKTYLWFIPWRRNIPFSAVMSVDVDYKLRKRYHGGAYGDNDFHWEKTWQLSLDVGSEKVKIYLTRENIGKGRAGPDTAEMDMQHLARGMRRFIGEEQLFERQKEGFERQKEATGAKEAAKKAAREEAVASFKRTMEEAGKKRKRQREEKLWKKKEDELFGGRRD